MRARLTVLAAVVLAIHVPPVVAEEATRASVVRIEVLSRAPDLGRPWKKLGQKSSTGTGVVIQGKRILTNAHVVRDAIDLTVQPDRSGEKLAARVEAIAPGVDLAVLKLEDESFFDDHRPLELSCGVATVQDAVVVYGYPDHGVDLSVTRGIVSRVDYNQNWEDRGFSALRIQVDAALNPGNSGGPVLSGDTMIGVAFSGVDTAENVGYVIPAEEIALFLNDIAEGRYDGKPVLLDVTRPLQNGALPGKLGLGRPTTGVLVIAPGGPEDSYAIRAGDIITRIGDKAIDNTGMVRVEGNRYLSYQYLVQTLARDNRLALTIVRDGRERDVEVPVGPERNAWVCPPLTGKGDEPSYFVYGPLALTEATREQLNELFDSSYVYLASRRSPLVVRYSDRPAFDGERLVYVAESFPHRLLQGYDGPGMKAVGEVNGVRVKDLRHMVELLRDAPGEYVEITFLGTHPDRLVFRPAEVLRDTESILANNDIRKQGSPELLRVWQSAP